jgi:Family of unknown function (DUF6459)
MPSTTLTPDPPASPGQRTPPESPASPGQRTPPESPASPGQRTPPESPASSELRLITVPAGWPPYDCESHGAACPVARAAALAKPNVSHQAPALAGPPRPTAPPLAPVQSTAGQGAAGQGSAGQSSAGQSSAGQATALPRKFAQVIVEILAGSRPLRQTVGWTTDRVRAQIGDLTQVLASDQRPRIRRVVTSQPAASVVEMTVVVTFGARSRALAMRFEHMPARQPRPGLPARPARWLCTELETG